MLGLEQPRVFFKNEMGFNSYVVKPLWTCLNKWLYPHINFAMENLENNIQIFTEEFEKLQAIEEST